MPGMNYQSITQMNGFRVYILEGDPSLKPGDRLLSATNRRTFPPPYCPIKRKRPVEACGNGQSVEACGAKVRGEDPVSSAGPIGSDSIRGAGTSIKCDHSPGTPDPVPDQPLALIKKRPFSDRPTSDHSRLRPPTLLQQMRPSVITCAPPSARNDGQDQPMALQTERGHITVSCCPETEGAARDLSCDSVVDEHFRRSLGWDYGTHSLAPSSVSVSGSVDEHFAKALGETWHWLQGVGDSEQTSCQQEGALAQEPSSLS